MKKLLFILATMFSFNTAIIYAQKESNAYTEITLLQQDRKDISPKEESTETRSMPLQVVYAHIYNNAISINFAEVFSAVNIILTNEMTGECIYTESHSNPINLNIDLNGESNGNYIIEIEAEDIYLEGSFSL